MCFRLVRCVDYITSYMSFCYIEVAAFMLELAIANEKADPTGLVTSVYFLEQAVHHEKYLPTALLPDNESVLGKPPTNLLKNIGKLFCYHINIQ